MLKSLHGMVASSAGGGVFSPLPILTTAANRIFRSSGLIGAVDQAAFTFSIWLRPSAISGINYFVWAAASPTSAFKMRGLIDGSNRIILKHDRPGFGPDIIEVRLDGNPVIIGQWNHFLISFTSGTSALTTLVFNGNVIVPTFLTAAGGTLGWCGPTMDNFGIGGYGTASNNFIGEIAEVYLDNAAIDLSVLANRELFIKDGLPVDLGVNGEIPSGSSPLIHMTGGVAGFETNTGTGGAFVNTGGVVDGIQLPVALP